MSSSYSPELLVEQRSLFCEVLDLLKRHQLPFAVSGAFALHEHTGIWRAIKDLDLFMPARSISRALQLFTREGLDAEVCDRVWLAKVTRNGSFVDLISGMSNGLMRVDDSWIMRALHSEVLGRAVRLVAPEELIASKIFVARRERFDGADVCHLFYAKRDRLNWARLMGLMGEHWQMLLWHLVLYQYIYPTHSDYVPAIVWDELLRRLKQELEKPVAGADFRGSLIDEKMFAIDVVEWHRRDLLDEVRKRVEPIMSTEDTVIDQAC